MLVEDGRITAVGPVEEIAVPAGATVLDLTGQVLIPGLVDSHSHIGIYPRPAVPAHGDGNDLALFDGDPFEYTSHVTSVVVGGEVVFERAATAASGR